MSTPRQYARRYARLPRKRRDDHAPLTPANNYTATVLFCSGSNIISDRYGGAFAAMSV